MKKEVSPAVIISIIVVALAAVGFFAFRTFFTDPNYTPSKGAQADKEYAERRNASRQNMRAYRDQPPPAQR